MDLALYLRIQAHANRLANARLHAAIARLPDAEFTAPRTSFFPSLEQTLNHILAVDLYYIGALHGEVGQTAAYRAYRRVTTIAELAPRQAASDARLIAWCADLDAARCAALIAMERGDHVRHDRAAHVLAHLLMHQTHHRGQAHAMLAGTAAEPPQLDEFLMPSEAHLRTQDMATLGWNETEVYGAAPRV